MKRTPSIPRPPRKRSNHALSTRRERGVHVPNKLYKQVVQRANRRCQECLRQGRTKEGEEVDHIIPIKDGGQSTLDNLQYLCHECHYQKNQTERGSEVPGSCKHGKPYSSRTRCNKCPATDKYWLRSARRKHNSPDLYSIQEVSFDGPPPEIERPNFRSSVARSKHLKNPQGETIDG